MPRSQAGSQGKPSLPSTPEQVSDHSAMKAERNVTFANGRQGLIRLVVSQDESAARSCWKIGETWANVLVVWRTDGTGACIGTAILGGQWVDLGVRARNSDDPEFMDGLPMALHRLDPGHHRPSRQELKAPLHDTDRIVSGKGWSVQTAFSTPEEMFEWVCNHSDDIFLSLPPREWKPRAEAWAMGWMVRLVRVNDFTDLIGDADGAHILIRGTGRGHYEIAWAPPVDQDHKLQITAHSRAVVAELNSRETGGMRWAVHQRRGGWTVVNFANGCPTDLSAQQIFRAMYVAQRSV